MPVGMPTLPPPSLGAGSPMGEGVVGGTAPAATKPDNSGMRARAPIWADLGTKALMEALKLAGPNTEEGQNLLKAIQLVAKSFPAPPSPEITQQELKLFNARANPSPMGDPANAAASMLSRINPSGGAPAPAAAPLGA